MANRSETLGTALDATSAVLFGLLALGAAIRLIARHQQSGFPFEFPPCLTRCLSIVFAPLRLLAACARFCCRCGSGGSTGEGSNGDEGSSEGGVTNASSLKPNHNNNTAHGDEYRYSHHHHHQRHQYHHTSSSSSYSRYYVATRHSNGSKKGYLVMLTLFLYATLRCISLVLFASGVIDSSGDVRTNMYRFFPALGFMALQSTMLAKWVDHVAELTLVLQNQSFRIGQFLVTCSMLMVFADATVTCLGLIDTEIVHFSTQPGRFWNILINMLCGVVYAFNGFAFTGLGCFLRWLWVPVTPMGVHASKRILGIALLFGVMCVVRGGILLMYIDDGNKTPNVQQVTHNEWGAPSVLMFEWLCLVISLLLLTVAKHHNNNAASSITSQFEQHGGGGNGNKHHQHDGDFAAGQQQQPQSQSSGGGGGGFPYVYPRSSLDTSESLASMPRPGTGGWEGGSSSLPRSPGVARFGGQSAAGGLGGSGGNHVASTVASMRTSMLRGMSSSRSQQSSHTYGGDNEVRTPPLSAAATGTSIQAGSLRSLPNV